MSGRLISRGSCANRQRTIRAFARENTASVERTLEQTDSVAGFLRFRRAILALALLTACAEDHRNFLIRRYLALVRAND